MKNYGMNYSLMASVFITMGYAQIFRLGLYLVTMMYHVRIFGYFEIRTKRELQPIRVNDVELKFKMIKFESEE